MTVLHADAALLPDGIAENVRLTLKNGHIEHIEPAAARTLTATHVKGLLLPGMANVHSHSFQRAFAGLAEWDAAGADNFWTWREAMYRFAAKLTPETQYAVAKLLFVEMVKAGYTGVGEFHYLHNDGAGNAFAPPEAMALAIAEAAQDAGIALVMLPALYRTGGADGSAPSARQEQFVKSLDALLAIRATLEGVPGIAKLGLALHSLRAVPRTEIEFAIVSVPPDAPIHVHAAEQLREVEECLEHLKKRPVEFLLDEIGIDARWCLVHATHMTPEETTGLARSGAVAGLCPSTEANLGDGIFPLPAFLDAGGAIAIGGDSHVGIDPAEELRLAEYAQRLLTHRRNTVATVREHHTAARLWRAAAKGGAKALGLHAGVLEKGARADFTVIGGDHAALAARDPKCCLDAYVFVAGREAVTDVMIGGEWRVRHGRHPVEDEARVAYRVAMESLLGS